MLLENVNYCIFSPCNYTKLFINHLLDHINIENAKVVVLDTYYFENLSEMYFLISLKLSISPETIFVVLHRNHFFSQEYDYVGCAISPRISIDEFKERFSYLCLNRNCGFALLSSIHDICNLTTLNDCELKIANSLTDGNGLDNICFEHKIKNKTYYSIVNRIRNKLYQTTYSRLVFFIRYLRLSNSHKN